MRAVGREPVVALADRVGARLVVDASHALRLSVHAYDDAADVSRAVAALAALHAAG